jgi:hypothetical protein
LINRFCVGCHNERTNAGGLSFSQIDVDNVQANAELSDKAARKLRARALPPSALPRQHEAAWTRPLFFLAARTADAGLMRPHVDLGAGIRSP